LLDGGLDTDSAQPVLNIGIWSTDTNNRAFKRAAVLDKVPPSIA
jgi:hypothetical protein